MWKKPWGYKEGAVWAAGLFITGLLLQQAIGSIDWSMLAWPANIIVLLCYLLLLVTMHRLRKRVYCFLWLSHYTAAVSSLIAVALITVLMGLVRQSPSSPLPTDPIGLSQMLSFWPFVLLYIWLTTTLGLTILRVGIAFHLQKLSFLFNHLGLFAVLLTATLGNADLQRLKMITNLGKTEWRATDEQGRLKELPLAIELHNFSIDEYPPKLMLIDNETGKGIPEKSPQHLLLEEGVASGTLKDWHISLLQTIPMAASVTTQDTLKFTEFHSVGATYAVYLRAENQTSKQVKEGWVSCGSFMFPYKAMRLDEKVSLIMPQREPQRFVSAVTVYTQNGEITNTDIEVNRPLHIDGWHIYQLSYDETKGRWSDVSVFELVRDPWLPYVYTFILVMMLGAVCLFLNAQRGKEKHVNNKGKENIL